MDKLFAAIETLLARKPSPVIAIDGSAAAGKTTLAQAIADRCGLGLVHTDDFFLPFAMRTPERLSEPGGNLDRERFLEEVIPQLGSEFSYRAFDCSSGSLDTLRHVPAGGVVVEGAYSLHPAFGDYCDLRVFLDISPELQRQRILARNGEAMWRRFEDEWIPMERQYHTAMGIKPGCDIILLADDCQRP